MVMIFFRVNWPQETIRRTQESRDVPPKINNLIIQIKPIELDCAIVKMTLRSAIRGVHVCEKV